MNQRVVVAAATLEIADSPKSMKVTLYKPIWSNENNAWGCQFEVTAPLNVSRIIYGVDSIQALVLALKVLSSYLYGSDLYRAKRIGVAGEFGGNLGIPATKDLLDVAPYPF